MGGFTDKHLEEADLEIHQGEEVCPITDCRLIHLKAAGPAACDRR